MAGVSVKSVSRWRGMQSYRDEVRRMAAPDARRVAGALQDELAQGAAEAVQAIRDLLRRELDKPSPNPAVVTAAGKVLVSRAPMSRSQAQGVQPQQTVVIHFKEDGDFTVSDPPAGTQT